MHILYKTFTFSFVFQQPVFFDVYPLFLFRSVLGNQLRTMCCISRNCTCQECLVCSSCVYACLFETIIPKDRFFTAGRERAAHPWVPALQSFSPERTELKLDITLIGKAAGYLPYIYAAFIRAGQAGILKTRVPFTVTDIATEGRSILETPEKINTEYETDAWEYTEPQEAPKKGNVLIKMLTPLRFKTDGRYTADFDAPAFMRCLFRRAAVLCSLYGTIPDDFLYQPSAEALAITDRNIGWKDLAHYSARQREQIQMGGLTGDFTIMGIFTDFERAILRFAQLFAAGKNTNFGLGAVQVWERME